MIVICCRNSNYFSEILHNVFSMSNLLSIFIGVLGSFIVAWVFFYMQYNKSTAAYRIRQIEEATKKIINAKKKNGENREIAMLRNHYRYSLGVVLDRITKTYLNSSSSLEYPYPNFIDYDEDGKGNRSCDGWRFFIERIKPVIDDINQYSFIGWMPSPYHKRLKIIVNICYQLQKIVETHDAIMDNSATIKLIAFELPYREFFRINNSDDLFVQKWKTKLETEYNLLESYWREWVSTIS